MYFEYILSSKGDINNPFLQHIVVGIFLNKCFEYRKQGTNSMPMFNDWNYAIPSGMGTPTKNMLKLLPKCGNLVSSFLQDILVQAESKKGAVHQIEAVSRLPNMCDRLVYMLSCTKHLIRILLGCLCPQGSILDVGVVWDTKLLYL